MSPCGYPNPGAKRKGHKLINTLSFLQDRLNVHSLLKIKFSPEVV
jgi:hypothetical protein